MFHTIVGWACFFAHADTESPRGHKLRAHPTLLLVVAFYKSRA